MSANSGRDAWSRLRTPKTDITGLVFLLLCILKVLYDVDSVIDIQFADEARYILQSLSIAERGLPSPQWAPLYTLWYRVLWLAFAQGDRVRLFYLSYVLLTALTPLLLFIYLRRISIHLLVAFPIALFYLLAGINLIIPPYPVKLATVILLIFMILATFGSTERRYTLLLIGVLLTSFIRPELAIAYLAFVILALVYIIGKTRRSGTSYLRRILPNALLLSALTALLIGLLGNPLAGNRSLIAFQQHFALNYVEWTGSSLRPWQDFQELTKDVFGRFHSVGEAAISRPGIFFRHVLSNALRYPQHLAVVLLRIWLPAQIVPGGADRLLAIALAAVLLLLPGVALIVNLRRTRGTEPPDQRLLSRLKTRLPALFAESTASFMGQLFLLLLIISTATLTSVLIIYPRHHYLQVQALLILIIASLFISNTLKLTDRLASARPISGRSAALMGVAALLLLPNLAHGWWPLKPLAPSPRTDARQTIRTLEALRIEGQATFLAAGVWNVYLEDNFVRVQLEAKQTGFAEFSREQPVDIIIWPETLRDQPQFRQDEDFEKLLANPAACGFEQFQVPRSQGSLTILVRKGLR